MTSPRRLARDGGQFEGFAEDDRLIDTGHFQRVNDLLLSADHVDVDRSAELLLREDEHANTGTRHVLEFVDEESDRRGMVRGDLFDLNFELVRGIGVETAGE